MSDLYRVFNDDADLPDDGLLAVEMRNPYEKPRIRLVPISIDLAAASRQWVETIPYDLQYEWDDPQSVAIAAGIIKAAIGDTK